MSPQEASAAGGAGVFSADRGGFVSRRSRRLGRFFGIWSRWIPSFLKRLDFFSLASRTCTFGTRRVRVALLRAPPADSPPAP